MLTGDRERTYPSTSSGLQRPWSRVSGVGSVRVGESSTPLGGPSVYKSAWSCCRIVTDNPTPAPKGNDTWIFVPRSDRDTMWSSVVDCFGGKIPIVDSAPGETVYFDGSASSAGQYAEWVVHIAPILFRQLAVWALATYAGKKLVDGFATEAGKDLWKGTKKLAELIAANVRHREGPPRELKLMAYDADEQDRKCSVEITFCVPDDLTLLSKINDRFERIVLPLIGCLKSKVGQLDVTAENGSHANWCVTVWTSHDSIAIDGEAMTFKVLHDPAREEQPSYMIAIRSCARDCGLRPA